VKNISFLILENFVRLGLGFFVSVFVARHLGPQAYGHFNYVISFVFLFIPFYVFGIDEVMIKDLVEKQKENDVILATAFFMKLFGGIVAILCCVMSSLFILDMATDVRYCIWGFSFIMLLRSMDVVDNWYQSIVCIKKISFVRMFTIVVVGLMKVLLVYWEKDWRYFVYISAVEIVITECLYLMLYKKDYGKLFFNKLLFSFNKAKKYFTVAYPIIFIMFLNFALARIDHIMIGSMLGAESLGKYAVAVKLVDIWQFLPFAMINSLFPAIVEMRHKKNEGEYLLKVKRLYAVLLWPALLFIGCVTFLATPLVNFLYGEAYAGAGSLLALYSWVTLFTFFTYARTKIFTIENAIKDGAWLALWAVILNIIFNYYLLQVYATKGAIFASLLAYFFSTIIMCFKSSAVRRNTLRYLMAIYLPWQIFTSKEK